jgi:hypothetical protein
VDAFDSATSVALPAAIDPNGSDVLHPAFTLNSSSIHFSTVSGSVSFRLLQAAGVGILVERIVGHHRLFGRVAPTLTVLVARPADPLITKRDEFWRSSWSKLTQVQPLGAVPRPTPDSGAHAAGDSGGKGGSCSRDAGRTLPFLAGCREREPRGRA